MARKKKPDVKEEALLEAAAERHGARVQPVVPQDEAKRVSVCDATLNDSSERKQAEAEAEVAAQKWFYESVLDSVREGIWVTDRNDQIIFFNQGMTHIAGVSQAEVIGVSVLTGFPEATLREFRPLYLRARDSLQPTDYEVFVVTPAGRPMWQAGWLVPRVSAGRFDGMICTIQDITERKQAESQRDALLGALRESDERVKVKLESILSPEGDIGSLELADIVDTQALQSLMDDFFKLTGIGAGILDPHGKRLVATGWQDICTQYHRVHPETSRRCQESDTELSQGVEPGTFRIYKCKNNLWEIVTPITVGGKHVANLFLGGSSFEDEPLDYAVFRTQAREYGFDEEEYLAALERARRSREQAKTIMTFYTKLAHMISALSYGNIRLARALTERDNLLASLRASEGKYRLLVENANEAIYVVQQGTVVFANRMCESLTGRDSSGLIGLRVTELIPADEREDVMEHHARLLGGEQDSDQSAFRVLARDGVERWVEVNAVRISWQGQPATLNFATDVTERKQAESQRDASLGTLKNTLRLNQVLLDAFPCVALLLRPQTREIVASNAAAGRAGAIPGAHCFDTWGQRQDPCPWCLAPAVWAAGAAQHLEVEAQGVCWEAHWIPVAEDLYMHYAFDVTERKQAEAERRKLELQLQQAQKLESLGVLAGGIAHDFNNILTVVLGNAELASTQMSPMSPARDYLNQVMTAGHRAADLCRQMLAYTGRASFVLERVDLRELIEEMAHLLKTSISKKAVLSLNLERGLPHIQADPSQIRQVVMNLIINASEAIGDYGGVITVSAHAIQCDEAYLRETYLGNDLTAGLYVLLTIADTGCGMDAETQARMFEPFFTTKFTGRGLGLAAVLGIVRAYRGALKIASIPGQGTTFTVLFPALEDARINGSPTAAPCTVAWRGSGTIMVVDDEENLRSLGRQALELMGFKVLVAADGREAVEMYSARGGEIDLVFLDLTMPRMDGAEALAELRRLDPQVRVVLASGYSREEVAARFAGTGLAGVVQKPYSLDTLGRTLAALLPAGGE